MKCPICQSEQLPDANFCNKCGANLAKYKEAQSFQVKPKSNKNIKILVGVIIAVIVVFAIISKQPNSSQSESGRLDLNVDQINYLEDLQRQGLISIEPNMNRAYINPVLWLQMDAQLKTDFSASLAIYCGNKKGTELYWVEIYDKQSGKKLAKYSHAWGFDVY